MDNWKNIFENQSFFYVTPDLKRGLGLECILPNYHIICSYDDPLIPVLRNQGANIFCLNEEGISNNNLFSNSGKLLENKEVVNFIKKKSKGVPNILLFKPSVKTELICEKMNYRLLVNRSRLNRQFENKISFHEVIAKHFPLNTLPSIVGLLKNLRFISLVRQFKLPFIIQFSLGWAGKTTFLIQEEDEYNRLVNRFPDTPVKVSKYVQGYTVLNNACIYRRDILISPPAYQLSGFSELCSSPFVTCGRQWPVKFLTSEIRNVIYDLTVKVGKIMAIEGYMGYFGLDFIIDENTGNVYISENNARFTASAAFWTRMEIGKNVTPLIIYHLAQFTGIDIESKYNIEDNISASQIILRDKNIQQEELKRVDFGVFAQINNNWKMIKSEYKPEKLSMDEIIYMKRIKTSSGDSEISRIETKKEVVKSSKKLQDWVREIL